MQEFADLVRAERERKGVLAYELARYIGVAASWVSRLEKGEMANPPTPEHLQKIADYLDLPEPTLLRTLGYHVAEDAPSYDPETQTIARAVRDWTPAQKKLLWSYIEAVSEALDAKDSPD